MRFCQIPAQRPRPQALADIVRGADTDAPQLTPESTGLYAAASGFRSHREGRSRQHGRQFPMYDAL
jgi:hypothetical protein